MKPRYLIPLLAFALLLALLAAGLQLKPRELPSAFIGRAAPQFTLPSLHAAQNFDSANMRGEVWMLNVWASWCAACRDEHPLLNEMAEQGMRIVGLNYKDVDADARAWLRRFGNPYAHIARDADGDVGIDFGVYGVPESYLIDKRGVIRFKQVGPLTQNVIAQKLWPLIKTLRAET